MHPLSEDQDVQTNDQAGSNLSAHSDARLMPTSLISFTADPASIANALSLVRLVAPRIGFLFSVRESLCTVTSHDGHREASSSFAITDVVGSGDFVYPTDFADEFAHVTSPIRLEAKRQGQAIVVGYAFGAGASVSHVSVDPRGVSSPQRAEQTPCSAVEVGILAEGLKVAKPFIALPDDPHAADHLKSVHVVRDGTLYASNGRIACYFRSEALVGREFAVAALELPLLERFLKKSSGTLSLQTESGRVTVANESGDTFAWARSAATLTTYPFLKKHDDLVALVDPSDAMVTLRHVQCALGRHERKVRIHFDRARGIWFSSATATSDPVRAAFEEYRPSEALVGRVDIDNLVKLFSGTASRAVEFRVTVIPPGGSRKEPAFFFRTIDCISFAKERGARASDASASVTRYAPGIDR